GQLEPQDGGKVLAIHLRLLAERWPVMQLPLGVDHLPGDVRHLAREAGIDVDDLGAERAEHLERLFDRDPYLRIKQCEELVARHADSKTFDASAERGTVVGDG